MYNVNEQKTL